MPATVIFRPCVKRLPLQFFANEADFWQAFTYSFASKTSEFCCQDIVHLEARWNKVLDTDGITLRNNGVSNLKYFFFSNKSKHFGYLIKNLKCIDLLTSSHGLLKSKLSNDFYEG